MFCYVYYRADTVELFLIYNVFRTVFWEPMSFQNIRANNQAPASKVNMRNEDLVFGDFRPDMGPNAPGHPAMQLADPIAVLGQAQSQNKH